MAIQLSRKEAKIIGSAFLRKINSKGRASLQFLYKFTKALIPSHNNQYPSLLIWPAYKYINGVSCFFFFSSPQNNMDFYFLANNFNKKVLMGYWLASPRAWLVAHRPSSLRSLCPELLHSFSLCWSIQAAYAPGLFTASLHCFFPSSLPQKKKKKSNSIIKKCSRLHRSLLTILPSTVHWTVRSRSWVSWGRGRFALSVLDPNVAKLITALRHDDLYTPTVKLAL